MGLEFVVGDEASEERREGEETAGEVEPEDKEPVDNRLRGADGGQGVLQLYELKGVRGCYCNTKTIFNLVSTAHSVPQLKH